MGPSRRRCLPTSRARSPRGHYPTAISTHHSVMRHARGEWKAGGPARGEAGAPPPASLAIGPLVARGTSSAPRSCAVRAPSRHRGYLGLLYRDAKRQRGLRRVFAARSWKGGRSVSSRGSLVAETRDTVGATNSTTKPEWCSCHRVASRYKSPSTPRWHDGAHTEHSGAPTMPPGRREGQGQGTQAVGPPRLARRRPEPFRTAHQVTELAKIKNRGSTGAEHVTWGGPAVARDPLPLALPSSAKITARPALSRQREDSQTKEKP